MQANKADDIEAEKIDKEITRATKYIEKQYEKRHNDYWGINIHTTKMKLSYWSYLLRRRHRNLNTTAMCAAALKNEIDMSDVPTIEVMATIKSLRNNMKQHYKEDNSRRDEFLLNQANLASDATKDEKANAIRNIKKPRTTK